MGIGKKKLTTFSISEYGFLLYFQTRKFGLSLIWGRYAESSTFWGGRYAESDYFPGEGPQNLGPIGAIKS